MKYIGFLICLALFLVIGIAMFNRHGGDLAVSPSAQFVIPPDEIGSVQARAKSGDCNAALRVARYHSNITLNFAEAIGWFRVAAKCPAVEPKEELISLLLGTLDQPDVAVEIDKLIFEIHKTNPEAARRAEAEVQYRRDEMKNTHGVSADKRTRTEQ